MIQALFVTRICAAAITALFLLACSTSNDQAPAFSVSAGQHPADWVAVHWSGYAKGPATCVPCHGSASDPKVGGTTAVGCFDCHATPVTPHQDGWSDPNQHGQVAAKVVPGASSGFVYCAKCHGGNFAGGETSVSCLQCHKKAPHPDAPWHGTTSSGTNHNVADFENASACATCHTSGANSSHKPATPAPAGTLPGCFNNTLCHGRSL